MHCEIEADGTRRKQSSVIPDSSVGVSRSETKGEVTECGTNCGEGNVVFPHLS